MSSTGRKKSISNRDNVPHQFDSDHSDGGDDSNNNSNNSNNQQQLNQDSRTRSASSASSVMTMGSEQRPRSSSSVSSKPKMLEHAWRFFHEKQMTKSDWTVQVTGDQKKKNENLKELCEFDTIQGFWSCFNNLPSVYQLETKDSFHLMKKLNAHRSDGTINKSKYMIDHSQAKKDSESSMMDSIFDDDDDEGSNPVTKKVTKSDTESEKTTEDNDFDSILPLWEDPANIHGGEWIFRVDKAHAQDVWRELVFAVIGEQYSDFLELEGDEICGISVSARPVDYVFQLWHSSYGEQEKDALLERTRQVLDETINVTIKGPFYKVHEKN